MSREELLEQVESIIWEEFEDDNIEITYDTVAADVDGWDSLAHISLMHEIEGHFKIKFTMGEIQGFKNVGELVDSIERHLA